MGFDDDRAAAGAGDVVAAYRAGRALYQGDGVLKNRTEAVRFFQQAADKDHAEAAYYLGLCYFNGDGVPATNLTKSAQLWIQAAEADHLEAMVQLGLCYARGTGVPKDAAQRVKWLTKAAQRGHSGSMLELAKLYQRGEGLPVDIQLAARWYEECAKTKTPDGRKAARELEDLREELAEAEEEAERLRQESAEAEIRRQEDLQRRKDEENALKEKHEEQVRKAEQAQKAKQAEQEAKCRIRIQTLPVAQWTEDDVAVWLGDKPELAGMVGSFRAAHVKGSAMLKLTKEDFTHLKVPMGLMVDFLSARDEVAPPLQKSPSVDSNSSLLSPSETMEEISRQNREAFDKFKEDIRRTLSDSPGLQQLKSQVEQMNQSMIALAKKHENRTEQMEAQLQAVQENVMKHIGTLETEQEKINAVVVLLETKMQMYSSMLSEMEERRKQKKEFEKDPKLYTYCQTYMEVLNATYQAAMVVQTDLVALEVNNSKGKLASVIQKAGEVISNIVPFGGTAIGIGTSVASYIIKNMGERQERERLRQITSNFPNPMDWYASTELAAFKLAKMKEAEINNSNAVEYQSAIKEFFKRLLDTVESTRVYTGVQKLAALDAVAGLNALIESMQAKAADESDQAKAAGPIASNANKPVAPLFRATTSEGLVTILVESGNNTKPTQKASSLFGQKKSVTVYRYSDADTRRAGELIVVEKDMKTMLASASHALKGDKIVEFYVLDKQNRPRVSSVHAMENDMNLLALTEADLRKGQK